MTLWPFYLLGTVLFWRGVENSANAKRTPVIFIGAVFNAVISFGHVIAVFIRHFSHDEFMFAIVTGAASMCRFHILVGVIE